MTTRICFNFGDDKRMRDMRMFHRVANGKRKKLPDSDRKFYLECFLQTQKAAALLVRSVSRELAAEDAVRKAANVPVPKRIGQKSVRR
jgi:hypothetical protein